MDKNNPIPITIDNESGVPIWFQLRNRLIYLISLGHFACGDKLPTVRSLAVTLGINFNTVSKVYQDIERDGYIVSRQGAGTFVSDEFRKHEGAAISEMDSLIDDFVHQCLDLGIPKEDIADQVRKRIARVDERRP